ncbi:MAG: hypothetical protein HKO99_08410 [Xanthomonadales bacterium]|nr:hypothetical protein [Gammaproteobacteria bacterium]MBT8053766.1 hypothetical protein [Gammaproteobacteria bacterium]NNK51603.1 hypothetical protein [Xanthomonadales bacterium]
MNKALVVTVMVLTATLAQADTFELSDPAAEIMKELNESRDEARDEQSAEKSARVSRPEQGIGSTLCRQHVADKRGDSGRYAINLNWLQGFIDGVGYQRYITLGDDRLSPVYEPSEMESWIENHCSGNPSESLFDAAWAFVKTSG